MLPTFISHAAVLFLGIYITILLFDTLNNPLPPFRQWLDRRITNFENRVVKSYKFIFTGIFLVGGLSTLLCTILIIFSMAFIASLVLLRDVESVHEPTEFQKSLMGFQIMFIVVCIGFVKAGGVGLVFYSIMYLISISFGLGILFALILSFVWALRKRFRLSNGVLLPKLQYLHRFTTTIWKLKKYIHAAPHFRNLDIDSQIRAKRLLRQLHELIDRFNQGLPPYPTPTDEQDEIDENAKRVVRELLRKGRHFQSASGYNPREFEFGPNPVIHAHLYNIGKGERGGGVVDEELPDPEIAHFLEVEHIPDTAGPEVKNPASWSNGPATRQVDLSTYRCEICTLTFRKRHELNKHLSLKHTVYTCPANGCDKTFSTDQSMKRHVESCHGDGKDKTGFKCPNTWCKSPDKDFGRKDNFARHVRKCRDVGGSV